jgi:hypothetical protein
MFWNDYKDPRGFHLYEPSSNKLRFVKNPYEIFQKIYYDDADSNFCINPDQYRDTFVKVVVENKTDFFKFEKLIESLYNVGVHDLKVIENLVEKDTVKHKDTDLEIKEEIRFRQNRDCEIGLKTLTPIRMTHRKTKTRNMKTSVILIVLGIAATIAAGFFLFGNSEQPETEFKGGELPEVFGSAADLSLGLYDVTYHVVNRNNAIFLTTARFYWAKTPDLKAVKEVVRIPNYLGRRHYRICDDCPISVRVLRQPVPPKPPVEERPEKTEEQ